MTVLLMMLLPYMLHTPVNGITAIKVGYTYYPEARGFLKLHRNPKPWDSARISCHDEGAILASPLHSGLLKTIQELQASEAHSLPILFSGVHRIFDEEGSFNSIDGVPIKEMTIPWASRVDRSRSEMLEHCLAYYADGSMADQSCDAYLPYFCFAELSVCEPGGRKKSLPTGVTHGDYELDARTGSSYKFHANAEIWELAYRVCQQEDAHLAIINSDLEATVLKELFAKYPPETINLTTFHSVAAIGFHSWRQTRSWWTIHGKTLKEAGYSRWGGSQPDSSGNCGAMFRDSTLDDIDCNFAMPFICEKSLMWWAGRTNQ